MYYEASKLINTFYKVKVYHDIAISRHSAYNYQMYAWHKGHDQAGSDSVVGSCLQMKRFRHLKSIEWWCVSKKDDAI